MPRQYNNGARVARGPTARTPGEPSLPNTRSLRERVGALRNLWPFVAMVWRTSPQLTAASMLLRLLRALLPVVALYIGKLIIDDVVLLVRAPDKPETFQQWLRSGLLNRLGVLLLAEFAVAVLTDVHGAERRAWRNLVGRRPTDDLEVTCRTRAEAEYALLPCAERGLIFKRPRRPSVFRFAKAWSFIHCST
jgi:ATP-binding cassette, subfamily B, bacterial